MSTSSNLSFLSMLFVLRNRKNSGDLVHVFKYNLIFKQHYTYIYTLFHLYIYSKNTNNVTKTTLQNRLSMTWIFYWSVLNMLLKSAKGLFIFLLWEENDTIARMVFFSWHWYSSFPLSLLFKSIFFFFPLFVCSNEWDLLQAIWNGRFGKDICTSKLTYYII